MNSEWVRLIVSVLSGLAATIPLVIQLVKYVRKTIQDKNWPVKASADTVNYDLDMDKISDLIDSLCDMSKIVNGTSNTAR